MLMCFKLVCQRSPSKENLVLALEIFCRSFVLPTFWRNKSSHVVAFETNGWKADVIEEGPEEACGGSIHQGCSMV